MSAFFHSVKIISMISIIFEFITRILIWIFRNIFEMIAFILRQLSRLLRLFYVVLPVTGIIYSLFYIVLTVSLFGGENLFGNILTSRLPLSLNIPGFREMILGIAKNYLALMHNYSGTIMYFVLFLLMLILIVPMLCVLIGIGVFAFCSRVLAIGLIVDAFIYLVVGTLLGKTPSGMVISRYKLLFPSIGHKIDEHSYNKWLRQKKYQDYYKDREDSEDYSEEDDTPDYEDEYDEYYDDDEDIDDSDEYYEDEFDEEYNELTDDEYEEEYIEDKHSGSRYERRSDSHSRPVQNTSAFDFFAGCTTRESADRKYKSLVKLYHPDNMDGDTAAIQEINVQYDKIKKKLS